MRTLTAQAIATPALEVLARGGVGIVRGSSSTAAHIDIDGFVVTITDPRSPLMPNGLSVTERDFALPIGAPVRVESGRMRTTGVSIEWRGAAAWDPTVPAAGAGRGALLVRATHILHELTVPNESFDEAGPGVRSLTKAVISRDPALATEAAERLLGRGPGLTPGGDDLLAAAAATIVALGPAVGFAAEERHAWLNALTTGSRARTTAVSATLLELATRGFAFEPAGRLLDLEAPWQPALERLMTIGSTTGWTWAMGCAATTMALAA
jgi:hypothetical protein